MIPISVEVSVLVITNNKLSRLSDLIGSLKSQSCSFEPEIVIAHEQRGDDGGFQSEHPDVKWISIPGGRGIPFNRNRSWEAATGKVVAFIDDDCVPQPDWLENITGPILRGDADATVGGAKVRSDRYMGRAIAGLGFPAGGSIGFPLVFPVADDGSTASLVTCNAAVRSCVGDDVGRFDESLRHGGEDTELGIRIVAEDYRIAYVPKSVVGHAPRETISGFWSWQVRRGRAKKQVSLKHPLGGLVSMRLRSYKNVIGRSFGNGTLVAVLPLLFTSILAQGVGFVAESRTKPISEYSEKTTSE